MWFNLSSHVILLTSGCAYINIRQIFKYFAGLSLWVCDSGHGFSYSLQCPLKSAWILPGTSVWVCYSERFLGKMLNIPKRLLRQMENMTITKRKWKNEEIDKEAQDRFTKYVARTSQGRLFKEFCYHLVRCRSKYFQKRVRFSRRSSLWMKVFDFEGSFCFPLLLPQAYLCSWVNSSLPNYHYISGCVFLLYRNFINTL